MDNFIIKALHYEAQGAKYTRTAIKLRLKMDACSSPVEKAKLEVRLNDALDAEYWCLKRAAEYRELAR